MVDPHTIQWLAGVVCLLIVGVLLSVDRQLFGYYPPAWYLALVFFLAIVGAALIAFLPVPTYP